MKLAAPFLLAVLIAIPAMARADTTGALTGRVTDENGFPLAGVAVGVSSPAQTVTTITDACGRFVFISLVPGIYAIETHKAGYLSVAGTTFAVSAGTERGITLRMRIERRITSVTVYDPPNLVQIGVTADVYSIVRYAPFYNTLQLESSLFFVPGITPGAGLVMSH